MKAYAVNVTNVWKAKSSPGRSKFAFAENKQYTWSHGIKGKTWQSRFYMKTTFYF